MHNPDIQNLLLGLTYLIYLTAEEVQQLWFLERSEDSVEKYLRKLREDEVVDFVRWSKHEDGKTRPQKVRWFVAPAGRTLIQHLDQYPDRPPKQRHRKVLEHDARTIATVVRLILIARGYGCEACMYATRCGCTPS